MRFGFIFGSLSATAICDRPANQKHEVSDEERKPSTLFFAPVQIYQAHLGQFAHRVAPIRIRATFFKQKALKSFGARAAILQAIPHYLVVVVGVVISHVSPSQKSSPW